VEERVGVRRSAKSADPPGLLTRTLSSTQTWRRGTKDDVDTTCDGSRDVDVHG
jgi:hypothetical protein